jgi:phage FluMu protein Com
LLERHLRPLLSTLGLAICALAFLMVGVCIWAEPTGDLFFPKATAVASIVAFACAYSCLLIRVPGGGTIEWLLKGALACLWALAALGSGMIVWEINADFWFRILGALGVLAASSSLALLILAKLRQVGKIERLESTAAQVELRCPRCTTLQVVDVGASSCASCGLNFRIEIEEPRCAKCDYLLWQLPQRRCPECGTPF